MRGPCCPATKTNEVLLSVHHGDAHLIHAATQLTQLYHSGRCSASKLLAEDGKIKSAGAMMNGWSLNKEFQSTDILEVSMMPRFPRRVVRTTLY